MPGPLVSTINPRVPEPSPSWLSVSVKVARIAPDAVVSNTTSGSV